MSIGSKPKRHFRGRLTEFQRDEILFRIVEHLIVLLSA